jgi:hypothetical protein
VGSPRPVLSLAIFACLGERFRCKPLRLALLRPVEKGNQLVDDGGSIGLRRNIGGDQSLGLDAQRNVGVERKGRGYGIICNGYHAER